jgi:hypothetical protein
MDKNMISLSCPLESAGIPTCNLVPLDNIGRQSHRLPIFVEFVAIEQFPNLKSLFISYLKQETTPIVRLAICGSCTMALISLTI